MKVKKNSDDSEAAKQIVELVKLCMKVVSVFTDTDHAAISDKLYFSKDNIKVAGVKYVARTSYLEERTLYSYRKKYCKVILTIMDYLCSYESLNRYINYLKLF